MIHPRSPTSGPRSGQEVSPRIDKCPDRGQRQVAYRRDIGQVDLRDENRSWRGRRRVGRRRASRARAGRSVGACSCIRLCPSFHRPHGVLSSLRTYAHSLALATSNSEGRGVRTPFSCRLAPALLEVLDRSSGQTSITRTVISSRINSQNNAPPAWVVPPSRGLFLSLFSHSMKPITSLWCHTRSLKSYPLAANCSDDRLGVSVGECVDVGRGSRRVAGIRVQECRDQRPDGGTERNHRRSIVVPLVYSG